jgi:hypothetical protein
MEPQMPAKDVAVVGVRLFGIFQLLRAINGLLQAIGYVTMGGDPGVAVGEHYASVTATILAAAVIAAALGTLCVWSTQRVVGWLFPEYRTGYFTAPMAALQRTALAIVGAAIVAVHLPYTVMLVLAFVVEPQGHATLGFLGSIRVRWSEYAGSAVGVLAGILLYWGAGWLTRRTHAGARGTAS